MILNLFSRIKYKILLPFTLLCALTILITLLLTNHFYKKLAWESTSNHLDVSSQSVVRVIEEKNTQLALAGKILASDFAFKEAYAEGDLATLESSLQNITWRVGSDLTALSDLDGKIIANNHTPILKRSQVFQFKSLLKEAKTSGTSSSMVTIDGQLMQLVVVPLKAPLTVAWMILGFNFGNKELLDLSSLTKVNLSVFNAGTELTTITQPNFLNHLKVKAKNNTDTTNNILINKSAIARKIQISKIPNQKIEIWITTSIQDSITSNPKHLYYLIFTFIASLITFLGASFFLARHISSPLTELTRITGQISRGNYNLAAPLSYNDEIGQLSQAVYAMANKIKRQVSDIAGHNAALKKTKKLLEQKIIETRLLLNVTNQLNSEEKSNDKETALNLFREILISFKFKNSYLITICQNEKAAFFDEYQIQVQSVQPSSSGLISHKDATDFLDEYNKLGSPFNISQESEPQLARMMRELINTQSKHLFCLSPKKKLGNTFIFLFTGDESHLNLPVDGLLSISNHATLYFENEYLQEHYIDPPSTDTINEELYFNTMSKFSQIAQETDSPFAVLRLSIDQVPELDPAYGAELNEKATDTINDLLRQTVRSSDIAGQLSPNQFVAILAGTNHQTAYAIANRFCETVASYQFDTQFGPVPLTISAGLCSWTSEGRSGSVAMTEMAEQALEIAQAEGGNCVYVYEHKHINKKAS